MAAEENRPRRNRNRRGGRNSPSRILLRWHRRLGETIAILLLIACATGFLLNHSEGFSLRDVKIRTPWILDWYGFQPEELPVSYSLGSNTLSWLEGTLYFNGQATIDSQFPVGAVPASELLCVATASEFILLTPDGELVERMTSASLPHATLVGIGVDTEQRPVINTPLGHFVPDDAFLQWTSASSPGPIVWSESAPTPPAIERAILEAYRGEGLSLYRLILDIHTGRFFGNLGPWIADLTVVGLVLLTLSGLYYAAFLRSKQRRD